MQKHAKTKIAKVGEEEEEKGDLNDIPCVDCHRTYALVPGASNCRCKRCNILYRHNLEVKFQKVAKKN